MADDTSYSTFLAKANADPNSGASEDPRTQSTSQARSQFDPTSSASGGSSSAVPAPLQNLPDVQYVSDTDSAFEPVFFSYSGVDLPGVKEFKQVLAKDGKSDVAVEELSVKDFDPRGEYTEIVERVKQVGEESESGAKTQGQSKGGVVVFRVQISGTRVEYYVLTVGERKLVGVVTKAVES